MIFKRNTFFATLTNKTRTIPFGMWWRGVMLVSFVCLLNNLIKLVSCGLIMPGWEIPIMHYSMKKQLNYRIEKTQKLNAADEHKFMMGL